MTDERASPPKPAPKRRRGRRVVGWTALALVLAMILAGLVVRFGLETSAGRGFVAVRLEGLTLGRLGRLHVEGVGGNPLSDVTVDRLTIADTEGVWLDARKLEFAWRPWALLSRRVRVTSASAQTLQILRRPVLGPEQPAGPATFALTVDRLAVQVETLPAASVRRGLFDLAGDIDAERNGAIKGDLTAKSRLRAGDGLSARFDFGVRQRLALDTDASEAEGGAIAGLLGLPAGQAFALDAHAGGLNGAGWLRLHATSGAQSIADADGAWTADGGRAAGRVSLAASRFTAPLMRALGPEARFTAAGRPAGHGLYGVALFANSDNAAVQAVGVADPARLTTENGVQVEASMNELSRVIGAPAMGRGVVSGRLTGGWDTLRLVGDAAVERLSLGGYALARVAGPIDLSHVKDAWRLKAVAAGEQGRGAGLLGALIGGRPTASLDATRLGDGRILIQALKVVGAGLVVDATGQQGLFGGLSFKGQATLANLAAAHAGAHGAVRASWSAAQAGRDKPWTFDVDSRGAGVASGYAELDRLLGPTPRLAGHGLFDHGVFAIGAADLTGAAASVHAAGPVGLDGNLKLALDWTAHGPFEVGPLEMVGDAKGSGAVTGSFGAPRADLIADFHQIDAPDLSLQPAHVVLSFVRGPNDLSGQIALTASSVYGPAHARADFRFIQGGLALSGVDAVGGGVTATGSLTLTGDRPSLADLNLSVGPGAVLTEGHAAGKLTIADAAGGPAINLALKMQDSVLRNAPLAVHAATLSAQGPLSHATYRIDGDLAWAGTPLTLDGGGTASEVGAAYAISFEGSGKLRGAAFHTLAPALISVGGPTMTAKASATLGSGRIDLDARQTGHAFDATAKLAGVDISALDADLAGRVDADLALQGHDQALGGSMTAHLAGARVSDASPKLALDGDLKATLVGDRIDLTASLQNQAGGRANLTVALPAVSSAAPFRVAIAEARPMSGRFDVEGEVEPIWQLLFGSARTLGGQVSATGTIGGTLNTPQLTGHASLANGRFEDSSTGIKLRNVTAAADFDHDLVDLHTFNGVDSKSGTLAGQGQLSLAKGGESTLTLTLKNFQLLDNETARATATGAVTLSRDAAGKAKLAGQLVIDRADISPQMAKSPPGVVRMDVVEKNRPPALDKGVQAISSDRGVSVALAITLRSNGGIFVRGLGVDAELALDASVSGTTINPVLTGTARVVRGDYQFAGQRFEFDNSGVVYLATSPDSIRLDLTARRDDPSLTAFISIRGTAAKPVITLSSTPTLPNDEILSQVLFGRSAAQLSAVEAAELAAAVTTLATGGGFDVLGGLQNFARLDRLALGGDSASGVTVSGGKYIGKNVYLELTGGGRSGPSAQVEVRAGHGLSVISTVGGEAGAKLAIRWRRDYGQATVTPKKQ